VVLSQYSLVWRSAQCLFWRLNSDTDVPQEHPAALAPRNPSWPQFPERCRLFRFKQRFGQARLTDDALKGAAPERIVERDRDCNGATLGF